MSSNGRNMPSTVAIPNRTAAPPTGEERCPVCDVELRRGPVPATVRVTNRRHPVYRRCPECRSFFANEPYDGDREVGHAHTRVYGQMETGVRLGEAKSPMFDAILRALRKVARPGGALLDVGCSYGNFMERARKEGYQVQGFDIVPEAVAYVRSCGFPCVEATSVADLAAGDNSLDVVTALDCNCYWPNHRHELRAIHARLRPGGLLVMRVVDTSWAIQLGMWIGRLFPVAGRKVCERSVYDHRVSIPVRSLLQVVREEGFSIVYTSVRDAIPFHENPLQARLAYLLGSVSWRVAGFGLAPGMVFMARKEGS